MNQKDFEEFIQQHCIYKLKSKGKGSGRTSKIPNPDDFKLQLKPKETICNDCGDKVVDRSMEYKIVTLLNGIAYQQKCSICPRYLPRKRSL
jgi:hypothetical protein